MDVAVDQSMPDILTVCLVDDDALTRSLFTRVIDRCGHRVICAKNPALALACLAESKVDLLLSDWRMPNASDGERLLRSVKAEYPLLNICMMSGAWESEETNLALSLGASECLDKPFSAERFADVVERLRTRALAQADTPANFAA